MRKSKLITTILALPLVLGGLTSCNSHQMKHGKFEFKPQNLQFLAEVTYDDYSWDDVTNWMNSDIKNNDGAGFGCSSVRSGNFYGRSFDFCITDMFEFLIRTPHTKDRYASMGVAIGDCMINEEHLNKIINGNGDATDKLNEKMLPFTMVDGINENGVVCNTNVVPAKDLTPHEGEEKYHTHGTNSGKEDLFYQFMPRFILDNATSAKHAIELLKNRNLTAINKKGEVRDYLGVSKMGYELHCMIADKDDTYVIEMVDDYMNIAHSSQKKEPVIAPVMTNFYLTNDTPSGAGKERYETLLDKWSSANTLEGMKAAIQSVQYSPCYNPEWKQSADTAMWPTEFAGCDIIDEKGETEKLTYYNAPKWCKDNWTTGAKLKDQLDEVYKGVLAKLNNPTLRTSELGGNVPWISTHAEVYDIENRTLHLVTQEEVNNEGNYNFKEFKLNETK